MTHPLTYQIDHRFPVAVVRLVGTLTPTSSPAGRAALMEALGGEPTSIIIDLSGLVAVDDVALTMFPAAARTAALWPGAAMLLCSPQPEVAAALHRMAVAGPLPVYATYREALAVAVDDPVPLRMRQQLAPTVQAPRMARELVAQACWSWGIPEITPRAGLLSSELVTNAVRHAGTDIDLTVTLRNHHLRVSVQDGSPEMARLQTPAESDDHGRGLLIVDSVAAGWGSVPIADGKTVWASLKVTRRPGEGN